MNSRLSCRTLLLPVTLVVLAAPAGAQVPGQAGAPAGAAVVAGDWIRARHQQNRIEGRVVRFDGDILVLAKDGAGDTLTLARSAFTDLEVSVGRRRNTLRGMGLGTLIGGTAVGLLAVAAYEPCASCFIAPGSAGEAGLWGFVVGAVPGFVIGGILGVASSRHVWQRTSLPLSIGVSPVGGGRSAAFVTIAF
jgi:hypothetical protein